MSSVAVSIKKKLALQKILHIIRLVMLFFFFIFLFNLEDYDDSYQTVYGEKAAKQTEQKVFSIEEIMADNARTVNYIGISVTVSAFLIAVLLEYLLVRCPKCKAHLMHLYTPNFCAKCGLNFNDCENEK